MSKLLPSSICVELAKKLHYFYCKHTSIFNSDEHIKNLWDSDSKGRGIWYDRAQELGNMLIDLGWKLPNV